MIYYVYNIVESSFWTDFQVYRAEKIVYMLSRTQVYAQPPHRRRQAAGSRHTGADRQQAAATQAPGAENRRTYMYVIFDMDGVIVDSEAVYLAGYLHAAQLYDLPIEDMRTAVDRATGVTPMTERAIMTETFGHLPQFSMDKTYKACRDYFNNIVETGQMKLKPGAAEILRFLNDNKIPTGLASSSPRAMIEKVLKPHDVLQYFDTVVSGDMVERGKPDPEIFLKCAAQLGIPESKYSETFVIEDSHNGIRAAYAAGMQPVMVPDLLPATDEMRRLSAAVLPSLTEVTEWLQSR